MCKIDSLDQRRDQAQCEINILIATAKGIRLHELSNDEEMLALTFQLFTQIEVENVTFTQVAHEIEPKYIKDVECLYRETKMAIKAEQEAAQ